MAGAEIVCCAAKTASQITQQVYATEGKGACCSVAITCESRAWKLRVSQQPAASQRELKHLGQDATACCRTAMCNDLKSEFRCLWLPFCEWKHSKPSSPGAARKAAGIEGGAECAWKKEEPSSASSSSSSSLPEDSTSLSRTIVYIHEKLREKEEELDRNSAALAAEESKLKGEEQVEHLTKEAEGLVFAGHYAEAERVLQDALRDDPDGRGSPKEEEKRARESEGLKDLGLASTLLSHLEAVATHATTARASSVGAVGVQQEQPSTKRARSASKGSKHSKQSPAVKSALRAVAAACIVLTAYITVGYRRGWRGTGVDVMAVELEEAASLSSSRGYRSIEETNPAPP